ncbi:MAG: acyl carrier protein [Gemmataceae bacterium]|nr:acyl carrier protein [Gemmata sp.]MDW8197111.1 acyl carrier protein [Gemmataceae bacterium]
MHGSEPILTMLAEVVRNTFPDRDFPEHVDISTRLLADLGLTSIELVVLGEKLEARCGRRLPWAAFLKSLRDRGASDISLGELVNFLQTLPP